MCGQLGVALALAGRVRAGRPRDLPSAIARVAPRASLGPTLAAPCGQPIPAVSAVAEVRSLVVAPAVADPGSFASLRRQQAGSFSLAASGLLAGLAGALSPHVRDGGSRPAAARCAQVAHAPPSPFLSLRGPPRRRRGRLCSWRSSRPRPTDRLCPTDVIDGWCRQQQRDPRQVRVVAVAVCGPVTLEVAGLGRRQHGDRTRQHQVAHEPRWLGPPLLPSVARGWGEAKRRCGGLRLPCRALLPRWCRRTVASGGARHLVPRLKLARQDPLHQFEGLRQSRCRPVPVPRHRIAGGSVARYPRRRQQRHRLRCRPAPCSAWRR